MPLFWTEERVSKTGVKLPYTEIHVAGIRLCFNGRFGAKLKEAAQHLERKAVKEGSGKHGENARSAGTKGA